MCVIDACQNIGKVFSKILFFVIKGDRVWGFHVYERTTDLLRFHVIIVTKIIFHYFDGITSGRNSPDEALANCVLLPQSLIFKMGMVHVCISEKVYIRRLCYSAFKIALRLVYYTLLISFCVSYISRSNNNCILPIQPCTDYKLLNA